jgi:hypothetical protein
MTLRFINEDDGSTSAVIFDYIRDGWRHDEAFFGEIGTALGGWMCRWNDDYSNPIHFETEIEAKKYMNVNYQSRNFFSNGRKYEL